MKKELVPVAKAGFKFLPQQCQRCDFWQSRGGGIKSFTLNQAQLQPKKGKASLGKLLLAGGKTVGYVNYAPAAFFPRLSSLPLSPASLDTIFIACFYILESYRGQGLGKYFLNCLERELLQQGYKSIETIVKHYPKKSPAGWLEFYQACGFKPVRQIHDLVLMRLDMKSLVTWTEKVSEVVAFVTKKSVNVSHEIR